MDKVELHRALTRVLAARIPRDCASDLELLRDYIENSEPVKRGQWIYGENEDGQDGIFCSECDHFVPWHYDYYDKTDDLINDNPRCPNCGAKMDGGDENA